MTRHPRSRVAANRPVRIRHSRWESLFLLPGLLTVGVFFLVPGAYVVYLSFFQSTIVNPAAAYVGGGNYRALTQSALFGPAILHTLALAVGVTTLVVVFGLLLATLLDKGLRGTHIYRTIFFLPYVFPLVVSSLAFMWLLQPQFGAVDVVLQALGLPSVSWLTNPHTAMLSIIIVTAWEFMGFYMLIFLSGLQGVDPNLQEAARVDGANSRAVFWKVTLPAISPSLFFALVFSVIQSFQAFDQIYEMTAGGPGGVTRTLTYYIYLQGFQFFNFGKAASASVVMMVLLGGITFAQFAFGKRWVGSNL